MVLWNLKRMLQGKTQTQCNFLEKLQMLPSLMLTGPGFHRYWAFGLVVFNKILYLVLSTSEIQVLLTASLTECHLSVLPSYLPLSWCFCHRNSTVFDQLPFRKQLLGLAVREAPNTVEEHLLGYRFPTPSDLFFLKGDNVNFCFWS